MTDSIECKFLEKHDLRLIADIDRSEHITTAHSVRNGVLAAKAVDWQVPSWETGGGGEHSVAHQISVWRPVLDRGALLIGAFDGATLLGLEIVEPMFEPPTAWLAFLHVGRPHRRRGAASALWSEAVSTSMSAGAESLYVSATPSGSAVGFYISQGCVLADPPHPLLFAAEPNDIHLTVPLRH